MTRIASPSLIATLLLVLLASAPALGANVNVAGTWKSDKYGTCVLKQTADRVEGTLVYPNGGTGNLRGTVSNRVVTFEWGNETDRGTGAFILSVNNSTLTGYWQETTGKLDDWILKKTP